MNEPLAALVADNVAAVDGVRLLTLALARPWPFVAGQVAELATTPGSEGYFAIASAPHEAHAADPARACLTFLVKAGDSDSEPLMRVAPGEHVRLRGPFGRGYDLAAPAPDSGPPDLLFVSAGTALAAVRSAIAARLADPARDPRERLTLLVGVRRLRDLCFADELRGWAACGVTIGVALSQEADDGAIDPHFRTMPGRVQGLVPFHLRPRMRAFIAGTEALEDDVTALLLEGGLAPEHIQRNYRPDGRADGRPPQAAP